MNENRKRMILVLLLALWGGIFLYEYYHQPEARHQPLKYRQGGLPQPGPSRGSADTTIRLDLLQGAPQPLVITKNIFEPIHIYVPPPPKKELPPPPPVVVLPPAPSPEEIARQQAMRNLSEFKYLGFLNKGAGKEQGFFSKGVDLFAVGIGETMPGGVILKELDPNQAVLKDKGTGVESTLMLSN